MNMISVLFQAYIPNSLGKSLLSYFEDEPNFNERDMSNYQEFRNKLIAIDKKSSKTWIPEPGGVGAVFGTFFSTDETDFHSDHSEHGSRLSILAKVDLDKIGKFSMMDKYFFHEKHDHYGGSHSQHSGYSYKVQALIQRIEKGSKNYIGIINESEPRRSPEFPLKAHVENAVTGTYYTALGGHVENDSSILTVSASAPYPYLKIAPNIDFNLEIKLFKYGGGIQLSVKGSHDNFPAYELVAGDKVIYNYNPADHGELGPSLGNLKFNSTSFNVSEWLK